MSRSFVLLIALTQLTPDRVSAQEIDPAQREQARELAVRAARDYNAGRHDRALASYEQAYAIYPAPGLLFNLGQCQRELGQHERAVESFERYLRERPDAPNRAVVLDLIAESRAILRRGPTTTERETAAMAELARARQELELAQQAGAQRSEEERQRYEAAVAELARAREALESARRDALVQEQRGLATPRQPELYEQWWLWTIIGVVVAAGVGVTLGVVLTQTPGLPMGSLGTIDAR